MAVQLENHPWRRAHIHIFNPKASRQCVCCWRYKDERGGDTFRQSSESATHADHSELMPWMLPSEASLGADQRPVGTVEGDGIWQTSYLAIDLAKRSFKVCATDPGGAVIFHRTVSRPKLKQMPAEQQSWIVAMEACATNQFWGRFAQSLEHDVRLIPPIYVKPFVKRQKNDAATLQRSLGGTRA